MFHIVFMSAYFLKSFKFFLSWVNTFRSNPYLSVIETEGILNVYYLKSADTSSHWRFYTSGTNVRRTGP